MADSEELSVGGILAEAWGLTTKNYWKLVKFWLVVLAISIGMSIVKRMVDSSEMMSLFMSLVSMVVNLMVSLGMVRVILEIIRGREPELADLFVTDGKLIIAYIGAMIMLFLGVGLGLLLFIIPGIYIGLMWSQTQYALVDEKLGAMAALKRSQALTKGHLAQIFVLLLLVMLINLGGLLLLGFGLLVTLPWTTIAMYVLYEQLKGKGTSKLTAKVAPAAVTATTESAERSTT